jgi:type II secretory pathway pseudopilin PulG
MKRSNRRGFTRLELGLVLGLVVLLAGGTTLVVQPRLDADETDAAVKDAQRIRDAAVAWRRDNPEQGCPTLSQLQHERRLSSQAHTEDPWGQRFRVDCAGDEIRVISPGRDGKAGTADDVLVPRSASEAFTRS